MKESFHEMRDPIHGFIRITKQEKNLIDTEVFQRLRRIRQLAMTFLVYPGALHTRFDHSIGVMHIAGRICTRLKELNPKKVSDEDVKRIRLAALLHDVGHGPFSHVSEHLLKKSAPKDSDTGQVLEKIHEKITVDIVRNNQQINELLSEEERDFVIDMIQGKPTWDWQRDIVSSELDADKMDYLLRDSYFTGVRYGVYDLEKLIESCLITDRPNTPLAINSKGIYALEQLLLARYHMTQQVYWHRVSLISAEMIIRGITLAIDGRNTQMTKLYKYPKKNKKDSDEIYEKKKNKFIQNYLHYQDEKVVDVLRHCNQEKAKQIFNWLYNRQLFKMIAEIRFKDEKDRIVQTDLQEMVADPIRKRKCEEKIAECVDIDPDYVIINKPPIRNLNYVSQTTTPNLESIMVYDEKQDLLTFLSDYAGELFFVRHSTDTTALETIQVYTLYKEGLNKKESEIQEILRSS